MHSLSSKAVVAGLLLPLAGASPISPLSGIGDITIDLPKLPASPINVGSILSGIKTSPVKEKREPLGLSIPGGLIPSIPGVTEPLTSNAPPLPVLQLPTPPLESPPFTPSNIKPKKIGYFWTGAGDNKHKDFLVTASLDDVSPSSYKTSWRGTDKEGHLWHHHRHHGCAHQRQLAPPSRHFS